jgi:CubicO group peptidase (beta-lactamase class C family)
MKHFITFLFLFCFLTWSISSHSQTSYFPPNNGNVWDTTNPESLGWCQERIDSLYNFLSTQNSKAFILIKDGKIVLEQYFNGQTATSNWYWASAGKTLTGFMVGLAQQDGLLNLSDSTSQYLGAGWTNCSAEQEGNITIRNPLTMTSGLNDGLADSFCTLDTCLEYLADPGTRWAYHNAPYTLLDGVIEAATGQTLNAYTSSKLGATGITGGFFQSGYNNVFVSNARSMARFGLLLENKGTWNGSQIMTDTTYFHDMVNTSQSLNKAYGYLTWLNGKQNFMVPGLQTVFPGTLMPNAPGETFMALGANGQFINVVPSQNLVWIRMGDAPGNDLVPFLLNDQIWEYINLLGCSGSITEENTLPFSIFPNPAKEMITISISNKIDNITPYKILDASGRAIKSFNLSEKETQISVSDLQPGVYFITNGNSIQKLLIH